MLDQRSLTLGREVLAQGQLGKAVLMVIERLLHWTFSCDCSNPQKDKQLISNRNSHKLLFYLFSGYYYTRINLSKAFLSRLASGQDLCIPRSLLWKPASLPTTRLLRRFRSHQAWILGICPCSAESKDNYADWGFQSVSNTAEPPKTKTPCTSHLSEPSPFATFGNDCLWARKSRVRAERCTGPEQFMDVLSRNWNTYIILHLCAWFPQRGSDSISTILTVLTLYDASQSTPCSSSSHFLSIFGTSKDWGQDVIGSELVILSEKIHASMVLIDKVTELTRQTKQPGRWLCLRTSFSPRSASWPGGHIPDSWTNQIVRDFAKS